MKQRIAVFLLLGMLPWAGLHAQRTATFRVTATVEESCDVATHGANLLRATCTPNATYNINLNKRTSTGVGTGRAVDHTLFGAAPVARVVTADDHADTITVHVYY
jgi:hypothetical protein